MSINAAKVHRERETARGQHVLQSAPGSARLASTALAIGLMLALPCAVHAGPLYGTVHGPKALTVSVACPSFASPRERLDAKVDDVRGSFAMRLNSTGRCEMRASANGRDGKPFPVFLSDNPLRNDFNVDPQLTRVP